MKKLILSLCLTTIVSNVSYAKDKIYVFKNKASAIIYSNIVPLNRTSLKLIRTIKINSAKKVKSVDKILKKIANKHNLDYKLLKAVATVESGLDPKAKSSKGATGYMQLMPETAKRFGVRDISDPYENIEGGAKYLKYLLKKFNYNYKLALAGYNAGENAVIRYNSIPPYRETKNYVQKVFSKYKKYLRN
jgi:soluble lytic murein transglycosylase-like protein